LRLPPRVDDGTTPVADVLLVPHPRFGIDWLADRAEEAERREVVPFRVLLAPLHERADGRRGGVEDRDLVLLDERPEAILLRPVGGAFVDEHGRAARQRAVDDVGVAGDPTDVGGAPVDVRLLQIEHPLARGVAPGEVAAGGVDDPLRLAGRARGVERVEHVLGVDERRRAVRGRLLHQRVVPGVAIGAHGHGVFRFLRRGAAHHHDHVLDGGALGDRGVGELLQRDDVAAAIAGGRGDEHLRLGVDDAIAQRLGGEAAEDDGVDGADARAGEHGHDGLGDQRHVGGDAVAVDDAEGFQDVGEFRDLGVELAIGERAHVARLALPDHGELVAARGEMTVEAVVRRVERAADEPLRVRRVPFEHVVPLRLPVELLGPAGPIRLAVFDVVDRFAVRVRVAAEVVGGSEGAVLLQQCVDLVCHERGLYRSDNEEMKRAAAVFAIAATAVLALWVGAAVSAQRTRGGSGQSQWPLGLGTLDAVPQRYPPRVASNDAARLTALAAAAGVDLSMPAARPRADRQAFNRWLDAQLTRADGRVDPPPPELAQNEAAIANLRAYLLGRTAIIWPTDVVAAAQAPLPNLFGLYALTRLLIAHALASPATAPDDLCAAWHLQRALWHRPELISKQVALAGTRMINAAARRLEAKPAWFDEITAIDYRRSILAAQQAEAWTVRKEVEDGRRDADRIVDVIVQPYEEVCAANLAAVLRRAAEQMSRSHDCAVAPSVDAPFW